ncbi:MAG: hotdog fold thioesterase [Phycisphaerae bacterium]|nr:hotdog fold thioesterase [Phycisphaerae bacterium]
MEKVKEYFKKDHFAASNGMELVEVSPGKATARMTVGENHLNAVGTIQGGAIFTLADLAFAAACNSHGTVAVAINVSISFVKAVNAGVLTAEARELSCNPRLGTYTAEVRDEKGDLVAVFQGLAYRKKDSLALP